MTSKGAKETLTEEIELIYSRLQQLEARIAQQDARILYLENVVRTHNHWTPSYTVTSGTTTTTYPTFTYTSTSTNTTGG